MGKQAKPDLSDLENYLSNNSIKSISGQFINIIHKKLYKKNIKVIRSFERKLPNFTFF